MVPRDVPSLILRKLEFKDGIFCWETTMFKDFESIPSEIQFLKEKIFSPGCHVFFDIDGTIKGSKTPETPNGFNLTLPFLLVRLSRIPGISVGACTSQSPSELNSFLLKMGSEIGGQLMDGLSILEDGHILSMSGSNMLTDYVELISLEAKAQIAVLKIELEKCWTPAQKVQLAKDGWGFFHGVNTPVIVPTGKYQGAVTLSIFESGPDVHDLSYQGQYEPVMKLVKGTAEDLGMDLLDFKEAGNGTLRVLEKGKSKEWALARLVKMGVIDLIHTVYFGDGLNDIAPARLITSQGGGVIAVSNAISELKQTATFITKNPESHGVAEVINLILSN